MNRLPKSLANTFRSQSHLVMFGDWYSSHLAIDYWMKFTHISFYHKHVSYLKTEDVAKELKAAKPVAVVFAVYLEFDIKKFYTELVEKLGDYNLKMIFILPTNDIANRVDIVENKLSSKCLGFAKLVDMKVFKVDVRSKLSASGYKLNKKFYNESLILDTPDRTRFKEELDKMNFINNVECIL